VTSERIWTGVSGYALAVTLEIHFADGPLNAIRIGRKYSHFAVTRDTAKGKFMEPRLKFDPKEIPGIARRYTYPPLETKLMDLKPTINSRGYLTKNDLERVAYQYCSAHFLTQSRIGVKRRLGFRGSRETSGGKWRRGVFGGAVLVVAP